jgi:hypothetical protein
MLPLTLNPQEAQLLTRILELYLEELRKAAAGATDADLAARREREEPLLRDLISQLAAQQVV